MFVTLKLIIMFIFCGTCCCKKLWQGPPGYKLSKIFNFSLYFLLTYNFNKVWNELNVNNHCVVYFRLYSIIRDVRPDVGTLIPNSRLSSPFPKTFSEKTTGILLSNNWLKLRPWREDVLLFNQVVPCMFWVLSCSLNTKVLKTCRSTLLDDWIMF